MYADWLLDRGDPLGELITVGCHLAALPPLVPGAARAVAAPPRSADGRNARAVAPAAGRARRGGRDRRAAGSSPASSCRWSAFVAHAEAIFRTAPLINRVESALVNGPLAPLRTISQLARVRHLRLVGDAPLEGAGPLFASSIAYEPNPLKHAWTGSTCTALPRSRPPSRRSGRSTSTEM